MSYIGNQVTSVPFITNIFSGDNSTVRFGPMDRIPASPASVMVFIAGVYKTPSVDYTLDSDYINFTVAPGAGSSNIVIHHMGNGVMATQVPADGTVTGAKISANSVRGNNIVAGQITGNLIGNTAVASNNIVVGAITGNLIAVGAITANHIVSGAISGNLLATNIINSNNIVDGAILGNDLGLYSVSGNNIGVGAVSANNFAGGGITSNVLASNLQISVTRTTETLNIFPNSISGTVNIDVGNSTVYLFNSAPSSNLVFNLRANTQNTFDSVTSIGQTTSIAIALRQSATRYVATLQIDGSAQTPFYTSGVSPIYQSISTAEISIYTYSVFKTAANTYTVIASSTNCTQ
jgi:hypothetical protein